MYIRFVTSQWDAHTRSRLGFFAVAYGASRSPRVPEWQRIELRRELDWFGDHLAVPDLLVVPTGHRQLRSGVCWFRDRAAEHVSRARYVVWILTEIGAPIDELRSERPGTMIWGDDHQIVALAGRDASFAVH